MRLRNFCSLILMVVLSAASGFAQEFTLTTTKANITSAMASLDMPGLTGNPLAIIVATPLGDTTLLNPNPIGVWYYQGKWNLFNSNFHVMPVGASYRIQFFLRPGPYQFLHLVTKENLGSEGSYIDNPALNNNPNAQIQILHNHAPEVRNPYYVNAFHAQVAYSPAAGRWFIANINGERLNRGSDYNVVVVAAAPGPPTTNNPGAPIATPTPPVRDPGGVVIGNYPIYTPVLVPPTPAPPPVSRPERPPSQPGMPIGTPIPTPLPKVRLNGFVDMHTHPMSHLGFGKKLMHGAPDGGVDANGVANGSLIPAGTRNCNVATYRASNIHDALGNCNSSHGGWNPIDNVCGDNVRALVITNLFDDHFVHRFNPFSGSNSFGDHRHPGIESNPQFLYTPHQTSKVHQQMWWEWIKRAKEQGNLRVMVALAVNSELLAEIINGDEPKDDRGSADLQIDEIKSFVKRHDDFMEVAYSSADLRRIVGQNKLAVVLGVEVDNIGNINRPGVTQATVKAEIQRLYNVKGVRYVFPIHLLDNKLGGTAVYSNLFNIATKHSTGSFFTVGPSPVKFRLGVSPLPGGDFAAIQAITATLDATSGLPYPPAFSLECPLPVLGCWKTFRTIRGLLTPDPSYLIYNSIPGGHVNSKGLTDLGKFAVLEMMKLGMLIDIDHMSDKAQSDTLDVAERLGNSYPLNIGHNGMRDQDPSLGSSERHATMTSVQRVAALGGVFGVGTANTDSDKFIASYNAVWAAMGSNPRVAMGTDVNGMEPLPKVLPGLDSNKFYSSDFFPDIPPNLEESFPMSTTGTGAWDYTRSGVAHYGLIADFVRDIRKKDRVLHGRLMDSSEYFALMWEKVEQQRSVVR